MIYLTYVVFFSRNFLSDHKGLSIYNEFRSNHVLKLPWIKQFWLGVRACDNMALFSKYILSFDLFLFLIYHHPADISAEKFSNPKDVITLA